MMLIVVVALEIRYSCFGQLIGSCEFLKGALEEKIKADIGNHYITHLYVEGKVPASHVLAPKVTHLRTEHIANTGASCRYLCYFYLFFYSLSYL